MGALWRKIDLTGLRSWTVILGRKKFSEILRKLIPEAPPVFHASSSRNKNSIVSVRKQFSSDRKTNFEVV